MKLLQSLATENYDHLNVVRCYFLFNAKFIEKLELQIEHSIF